MFHYLYLPLRPAADRDTLHEGEGVSKRKLLRYATLHRRAAALVPLLHRDGWNVAFVVAGIYADHPDVATGAVARERLAALGINPNWVEVYATTPRPEKPRRQRDGAELNPQQAPA